MELLRILNSQKQNQVSETVVSELFWRSATLYEQQEQWREAVNCWIAIKEWRKAANCYMNIGEQCQAAELYAQAADYTHVAPLLLAEERYVDALDNYRHWLASIRENDIVSQISTRLGIAACLILIPEDPETAQQMYREARAFIERETERHSLHVGQCWEALGAYGTTIGRHDLVQIGYERALAYYGQQENDRRLSAAQAYLMAVQKNRLLAEDLTTRLTEWDEHNQLLYQSIESLIAWLTESSLDIFCVFCQKSVSPPVVKTSRGWMCLACAQKTLKSFADHENLITWTISNFEQALSASGRLRNKLAILSRFEESLQIIMKQAPSHVHGYIGLLVQNLGYQSHPLQESVRQTTQTACATLNKTLLPFLLEQVSQNREFEVRKNLIHALSKHNSLWAKKMLQILANDSEPSVRELVQELGIQYKNDEQKIGSTCSFCGKNKDEVRELFVTRHDYNDYICDECVQLSHEILIQPWYSTEISLTQWHTCLFCGKSWKNLAIITGPGINICHECVDSYHKLLSKTEDIHEDEQEALYALILLQYNPSRENEVLQFIQEIGEVPEEKARKLLKVPSLLKRNVNAQETRIAIERFDQVGAIVKLITMKQLEEIQRRMQQANLQPPQQPQQSPPSSQMTSTVDPNQRYALILRSFDPAQRRPILELLSSLSGRSVAQLDQNLKPPALVLRDATREEVTMIAQQFQNLQANVKSVTMAELQRLMAKK